MSPTTWLENYATCQLIEKGTPANSPFGKYAVLSLHWVTEHITCYLIGWIHYKFTLHVESIQLIKNSEVINFDYWYNTIYA